MTAQHRGKASDQGGEHGSVSPVPARLRFGSAQYRDLVAQDEQLEVLDDDARPSNASQLRSPMRIR
jgi:hypothetical protein